MGSRLYCEQPHPGGDVEAQDWHDRYHWDATDRLARGEAVPGGPGACTCAHGKVWHRHKTRTRPCEAAGCDCRDYAPERMGSLIRRPVAIRRRPGHPILSAAEED